MRLAAAGLLAAAVLSCPSNTSLVTVSPSPHALNPSPTSSACPLGDTIAVDFSLTVKDNGRSVITHLCAVIAVLLVGPPASQWGPLQTSDEAVVAVLPLPLPAPPPHGARLWFQARGTGLADLYSDGPSAKCAGASGCPTVRWTVHVTVVP